MLDSLFRKLPEFKGKQRIARALMGNSIANKRNFWVNGKNGCQYFLPNLIENIGFEIYVNGIFEEETSNFLAEKIPQNGVLLDLGANIGTISIPLIKQRSDIKIVCVEAAPNIYECLQKNLAKNNATQATAINKALYYNDGEELNFYSPEDKFGKGSFSPVFTDKVVKVGTIKVDTMLEQLQIKKVDMIKIDVEGYEYHVFLGAKQLLSREDAPDILFEFADWAEKNAKEIEVGQAQQILKDFGYTLYLFKDKSRLEKLDQVITNGFYMLYASKKPLSNN